MKRLEKELTKIYRSLINKEFVARQAGNEAADKYRLSAINLVRYITLRNLDLRIVHDHLSELGISSLRSCEGYVMQNVISALKLVKLLKGEHWKQKINVETIGYKASKKLLARNTKRLLNLKKNGRLTKIIVTLPLEAAQKPDVIRDLLSSGMEIARIDIRIGDHKVWAQMITSIKSISKEMNKKCRIYMDIFGEQHRVGKFNIKSGKGKNKKSIKIKKGEHLIISNNTENSILNKRGANGTQITTPKISIEPPRLMKEISIGDTVLFDDGRIKCRVLKKDATELEMIVTSDSSNGLKLREYCNIHLPDTNIERLPISKKDFANLPFMMEHTDIIGYSSFEKVSDISNLHKAVTAFNRQDIGIIYKVKNHKSFDNLPMLLLEAMKHSTIGIQIERNSLAIDIGAERIAEVQDQIMWICEAAHIPVIWSSQVLEKMIKTGKAPKAEITDAAKSARAEAVMLNNGPHTKEAVALLSDILNKMEQHTSKKKNVLRALKVSKKNMDRIGRNTAI